jgi:hypothetical protein
MISVTPDLAPSTAAAGPQSPPPQLSQQQPKRGIRWRLGGLRAQQFVQRLAVPFGETLHAEQRTLAAQDRKGRHQQHPPLRKADAATHAAIGQCLEKTDQISCGSGVLERRGQRKGASPAHKPVLAAACQRYWDRLTMVHAPERRNAAGQA